MALSITVTLAKSVRRIGPLAHTFRGRLSERCRLPAVHALRLVPSERLIISNAVRLGDILSITHIVTVSLRGAMPLGNIGTL